MKKYYKLHKVILNSIIVIILSVFYYQVPNLALIAFATTEESLKDILFDRNNEEISQSSLAILKENINKLKDKPELNIILEGYSDTAGDDDYNFDISLQRAEKIKKYLVQSGIEDKRIKIVGKGETDKFGKGESQEALGLNRRVIFIVENSNLSKVDSVSQNKITGALPETIQIYERKNKEQSLLDEILAIERNEIEVRENVLLDEDSVDEATSALHLAQTNQVPKEPELIQKTELPPLPVKIQDILTDKISKLAPGEILFEAQQEMRIGKEYLVDVEMPNSFIEKLSSELSDESLTLRNLRLADEVIVNLIGKEFEVEAVEEIENLEDTIIRESGFIAESVTEYTNWKWFVSPKKDGFQTLTVSIIVNIEDPKYAEDDIEAKTFEKVIYVKPSFVQSLLRNYLLMTIVIFVFISFLCWYVLKKYGSD